DPGRRQLCRCPRTRDNGGTARRHRARDGRSRGRRMSHAGGLALDRAGPSRQKGGMKRLTAAALLALLPIQSFAEQPAPDPLAFVDPMIGTGPEGHTSPGATAPFGMVQLSPDTDATCQIRDCYDHAAGYSYHDPTIQGFSHTQFSGA